MVPAFEKVGTQTELKGPGPILLSCLKADDLIGEEAVQDNGKTNDPLKATA